MQCVSEVAPRTDLNFICVQITIGVFSILGIQFALLCGLSPMLIIFLGTVL